MNRYNAACVKNVEDEVTSIVKPHQIKFNKKNDITNFGKGRYQKVHPPDIDITYTGQN